MTGISKISGGAPEKKAENNWVSVETEDVEVSWQDFTQNTTFHGIKYIFNKAPFKGRRYL